MEDFEFEWDDEKATSNLKKHGVSFDDPGIATIFDPDHSGDEDRYVSIGVSAQKSLLVVVHIFREERIRLISCRKATSAERKNYENK